MEVKTKANPRHLGKYGVAISTALTITDMPDAVRIQPVHSQNKLAHCYIDIPLDALEQVTRLLAHRIAREGNH